MARWSDSAPMSSTTTSSPSAVSSRATSDPTRPYPQTTKWFRMPAMRFSIRLASRLPLAVLAMMPSATKPTVPKMMPMAATESTIVQTWPARSIGWTSLKPTVASVMTDM